MYIKFSEITVVLEQILQKRGFRKADAELSARLFTEASRDGVASHGLNRFDQYVAAVERGEIDPTAVPEHIGGTGALERWDGRHGPGNLNAWRSMGRAMELAERNGIGCVALARTNHWMRGGAFGWQAADAGFIGICWTNTIGNLPPWGSADPTVGNNPMIFSVPRRAGHIVLDFAMSQYSYGRLSSYRRAGKELPFPGGYDSQGNLTTDPAEIERTQRPLPIGMWKGSGLALMLDLLAALLSGGDSTSRISARSTEHDVSQVFMAIRPPWEGEADEAWAETLVEETIAALHRSKQASPEAVVRYPGERVIEARRRSEAEGVEVDDEVWDIIVKLRNA